MLKGGSGLVPYITRSDRNNGIDSFIEDQSGFKKDEQNVISVGLDTQTAFYQPASFYTGQNIQVFRNANMNKSVAMFLLPLLKKQFEKFNWGGNGATLGRLKKLSLMVPVTSSGQPDYPYMETYMRKKESEILTRYVKHRLSTL